MTFQLSTLDNRKELSMKIIYAVMSQASDEVEGAVVMYKNFTDPRKALDCLREVTDNFTKTNPHYFIQELHVE